jgi:hypothetical protein
VANPNDDDAIQLQALQADGRADFLVNWPTDTYEWGGCAWKLLPCERSNGKLREQS